MDSRMIGTKNADGSRVWPETDINGNRYDKVAPTTVSIGGGRFVILPPGFRDYARLEQLKGEAAPAGEVKPVFRRKGEGETYGSGE